ncbi:MAG: anthranilate phosphoribosyltransferase [Bacteroidota bacterium]
MIQQVIARLANKEDLPRVEARAAMSEIMSGEATPAQIAAFLVALRLKGETMDEITGCAQAMREKATRVRTNHPVVVDTCGTGGDGTGSFNVSTGAAFVACGAGAIVAKHGNRAVSSRCGSADVLRALGVKVDEVPVEKVEQCLDEVGMAFLFAPSLHVAMKHAAPIRRELGIRTVFNILGPLTNPAGATRQLIGVYDEKLTSLIAGVLKALGSERALVVHGAGGLDEISTCGPTKVNEICNGEARTYTLDSSDLGIHKASTSDLMGGDAATNARILLDVLEGKRGPHRDIVVLNAAATLYVSGLASSVKEGIATAENSIDSGTARSKLAQLVEATNR